MRYPIDGLPENLSARDYYELGLKYRLAGWVGVARAALQKVVEMESLLDSSSEEKSLSQKARKVLKTQLPRVPVPQEAEQKNIEGFNLMHSDREKAKGVFQELMATYPDFEWPFSNTARLKLSEGDLEGAKSIVKYLLTVNPDLLSAIDLMVRISIAERNMEEALIYLDRALELYPHEDEFKQLKLAIKLQAHGEPPDVIPDDLSPEEFYTLGMELQAVGRLEEARTVLTRVEESSEDEDLSARAKEFIRTQLPKNPIAKEAQDRCIAALKAMAKDQAGTKTSLINLTMEYPDFEWPFLFLGNIYMLDGNFKKAERLIKRVITQNPDLVKAKHLLISVYFVEGRYKEALAFIDEALDGTSNDDDGLALDLLKAQCHLQDSL